MSKAPSPPNSPAADNQEQLVKKFYGEICAAAEARDFTRAEALRSELLKRCPMALKEIIGSAEIIEDGRAAGIDKQHLAVWDHLYKDLSREEKNCLFYSMKRAKVPPKRVLLAAGSYNTRLFFIDSGKVVILSPGKGKNRVVAQLGRGQLLGEYTFTSISLCSATAVSHTEVDLYCLDSSAMKTWDEKAPGLSEKIERFCLQHGHIEDISQRKKQSLENKPRSPASGRVVGYLLNKEGKKTENFLRGALSDISKNGCCIGIKLSNKVMAKALLTRQLMMTFFAEKSSEQAAFQIAGKIVKVSPHIHNDYSIHLKFAEPLTSDRLAMVVRQK